MDWYITNTIGRLITRSIESGLLNYYRSFSDHVFGLMQRNSEQMLANDEVVDSNLNFLWVMHALGMTAALVTFAGELGWSAVRNICVRIKMRRRKGIYVR